MALSGLIFLVLVCGSFHLASGQACPYGWYGYTSSSNSKCYRFVTTSKLAWQDARDFCQLHGGDLLRIDSTAEKNWVYGQIRNIASHNHQVSASNWWTGLNNREYLTTWEWADGTAAKYINWKPGEPNNAGNDERCGEIMYGNSFNDETCSDNQNFICFRSRGIPLNCDADRGWQTVNGQCYKVYAYRRNWNQAQRQCDHDGGVLATVDNSVVELAFHDFAVSVKQPLWIGVHSFKTGTTTNSWIFSNGTQPTTAFWNNNKAPTISRNQLNTTCITVSQTAPALQGWTPAPCTTSHGFICQKPEGVCFPGWIGHRGYCYQFDAQFRLSFTAAFQYCQNQGSELMRIATGSDQAFLVSYLDEMRDSGVTSFWIGLSDNNVDTGPYKWRNGQTVAANLKNLWATANHVPINTPHKQDCVFIATTDRSGRWRTTSNCASTRAFVCRIPMGRTLKTPPSTPIPRYGCPAGWRLHRDTCFRLYDRATNAVAAQTACQSAHVGAALAKIVSADMQNFVNGLIRNKGVAYHIGLNDQATDGVYVWNAETTTTTYTNWARGQPSDPSHTKSCVVLRNSQWSSAYCYEQHMYICSMLANSSFTQISTTPQADWSVKCGPGWESNPVTDSCYQFVDQPLAWMDARLQCRVAHSDLLSIESLSEQNYLAGRLKSMSSIAVWTGANDRSTEGGWSWVAGKPFAYLNWAPGQPAGNKGGGTDCVAMFTSSGMWDDVNCNTRNGYICEKKGNVPTTQPPTTKAVTVPAGRVLGCYNGWLPYGSYCYLFSQRQVMWDRASQYCAISGSRLASILSPAEQNFIAGNLPHNKPNHTYDGYWIGFNDKQVQMSFQWTDGSIPTYTNWEKNEPNNWMNSNEDCVEIRLKTRKWNDFTCTTPKQGFICKRPKSIVSSTQSPYQQGCKLYHRGYGPYCYFLSGSAMTWTQANAACKTAAQGTLATVNDRYLQAFLSSWLALRPGFFWIGINDNAKNGSWVDGTQIQYTNWDRNHTGNEAATCVAMKGRPPAGFWENFACSSRQYFACQYLRANYTRPTIPTPYPNVPCPSTWIANGAGCYKVYTPSAKLNWMESLSFCQGLGGSLASFHPKNNDSFLAALVKNTKYGIFFIGLNDRDTEGGYKWSDGSAVDYTNWNPGEPNDYGSFEDCVVYTKYGGGWNDISCYSLSPFICMLPRGAPLVTTAVPPTAITSSQCGSSSDWIYYNGSCFLLSPISGDNASLSWYDAEAYCEGNQATLASFHAMDEILAVLGASARRQNYGLWIGLNILGGDSFRWADGSPLDFDNWSPNQPDYAQGIERCAVMFKSNGKWNDDQCNLARPFLCRRPVHGIVTPSMPAPYQSGGCKNGFTQAPGGRNKCFYVGGVRPGTQKTFDDAVKYCRSFGAGYDIASIEDRFEQEFVTTMMYGYRNSLWIGMQDRRGNNKFFWTDNAPVVYTNWDRNEPTSAKASNAQGSVQNCVVMRMYKNHEGRWADLDCSTPRAYVCQAHQDPSTPIIQSLSNCPKNYKSYRNSCYKLGTNRLSWNDALTACQADGGSLVSVLDVFEKAFVFVVGYKNNPYWIGLSDSFNPGLYGWSDGNPVVYSNWGWGEPSYGQIDQDQTNHGCVFVNGNGRWNDSDCGNTLKYICKFTTATPPPTMPPTYGNCSQPGAYASGDNCYVISVNQGRSWPEANYECQKMGMSLASVHSVGDMQFVFHLTSQAKVTNPKYRPNIWLGMSKGPNGAYTWTDGTPVNYLSWAPGEPSTLGKNGNQEECIEYDRISGSWNDVGCMSNRGYVCKSLKPTATSPLPSGFKPINPGQAPVHPPTYSVLNPVTDTQGVRPGQGVSKMPQVTYPNGVPDGKAPGKAAPSQQISTKTTTLGLSNGGIAGVVIASVAILVVLALLVLYLKRSGRIKPPTFDTNGASLGFDNALYQRETESVKIESDA